MLCQTKDLYGVIISIAVAGFIVINEIVIDAKAIKDRTIKLGLIVFSPVIGYMISKITIEKPQNYYDTNVLLDVPFLKMMLQSKVLIGLIILSIILFIVFIVMHIKNKKVTIKNKHVSISKIVFIIEIVLIIIIAYKVLMVFIGSISYIDQQAFFEGWKDFFFHPFGGVIVKNIYSLCLIYIIATNFIAIKSKYRKINIVRAVYLSIVLVGIGILVLMFYSTGLKGFQSLGKYADHISWERYIAPPIIMLLTYIAGYYILVKNAYKKNNNYRNISIALSMLIFIRYMPYPGSNLLSRYSIQRNEFVGVQNAVKEDAEILKRYLSYHDNVLVVSYEYEKNLNEFGESRVNWLRYEISPINIDWNFNQNYMEVDDVSLAVDIYKSVISKNNYLYIQSAGPEFYEKFGVLFPGDRYYSSNALYMVIVENDELELVQVYVQEDRLLE